MAKLRIRLRRARCQVPAQRHIHHPQQIELFTGLTVAEEKRRNTAARAKAWRDSDPERKKRYKREWRAKNPEKFAEIMRNNERKKRNSPKGRINRRVREAIREWFKSEDLTKGRTGQFVDRFGYTSSDLVRHLERQFLRGMSWENYGKRWHIDHIVPLAAFRFASVDDPEFKAAWALTNLRPLWSKQNIAKGAKRTHLL